jgi:hypothetical protein
VRVIVQRTTVFLLLLICLFAFPGYSSPQDATVPPPSAGPHHDDGPIVPDEIQKEMEKKANLQRQADLKRDTEKLLKLSTELKEYVDKTNENVMSLEVIKKADEIEKLAHSVKMKMRGDY